MTITKNTIVTLDYTVTTPQGHTVDEGQEPLIYVHGGYNNIFTPIETGLEGKSVGDSFEISVPAAEAFGLYDDTLVVTESLANLPEDIEIGMQIEGHMEGDEDDMLIYIVQKITDNHAVLDANHPLAGIDMVFTGKITEIVPADEETIQRLLEHSHDHH